MWETAFGVRLLTKTSDITVLPPISESGDRDLSDPIDAFLKLDIAEGPTISASFLYNNRLENPLGFRDKSGKAWASTVNLKEEFV